MPMKALWGSARFCPTCARVGRSGSVGHPTSRPRARCRISKARIGPRALGRKRNSCKGSACNRSAPRCTERTVSCSEAFAKRRLCYPAPRLPTAWLAMKWSSNSIFRSGPNPENPEVWPYRLRATCTNPLCMAAEFPGHERGAAVIPGILPVIFPVMRESRVIAHLAHRHSPRRSLRLEQRYCGALCRDWRIEAPF